MNYIFFQRPALVFSLASLSLLTCIDVPFIFSLFCLVLWVWKWLSDLEILPVLSRKVTTALSILLFAFIFIQYRNFWSQESSSALLVGLTAIKVMDYCNRRDHLSVILLGFLLLTLKPLYGMELSWLPIQLACMISLWWALSQDPKKIPRRVLGLILALAMPIALVLFLVFPRVVLPWAMAQNKGSAGKMGFSTDLNPGQIAELATSTDLVFRVRFKEKLTLHPEQMYWKGAVLTVSNGFSWKESTERKPQRKPNFFFDSENENDDALEYEIVMEPGSRNVLFTLDPTTILKSTEAPAFDVGPFLWRTAYTPSRNLRFDGTHQPGVLNREPPTENDLQHEELPPKTKAWVEQVQIDYPETPERIKALRNLYNHPDFTYTLTPGIYNEKVGLDEFLFEKRRGFCEHFAGSFATLSRALGIPARVIGGYQGAEFNSYGEFWSVTQRQAHAWSEYWNGESWERVDPTTWVAKSEYSRISSKSAINWVDQAMFAYEAMNFRWSTFLIDFDQNTQKLALKELLPPLILVLIVGLFGYFVVRVLKNTVFSSSSKLLKVRQNQLSLLVQQIKEFEEEIEDQELSHLPPLTVLKNAQKRPGISQTFYRQVADLYDQAFYQENIDDEFLRKSLQGLQKKWVEIQFLQK